jgi:hypothetical protein
MNNTKTKVAYFLQEDYVNGLNPKIWFDFNLEKTDDEILLVKSIAELTEDEALWVVFLAQTYYKGDYLDEVNYLRNKYNSVEECFEKGKCPLGGDNYEVYNNPNFVGEYGFGFEISERLYKDAVKQKINA